LPSATLATQRTITLGKQSQSAAVLDRAAMPVSATTSGPALCVEPTTTTVVPSGWKARLDAHGLLHLLKEAV
jgi:N-methylhydantoinase A/oxoprolinase/acetone carboxylase beta subunit